MKHPKQGKIELEILLFVIIILTVSGTLFGLIRAGILNVRPGTEQVSVLNAEFIPFTREGTLAINTFQFCGWINEQYACFDPRTTFAFGEPVRFTFVVESSPYNGRIKLVENYRVTSPRGKTVLEAESKNDFNFEMNSKKSKESLSFQDYFVINSGGEVGIYILNLILYNPLIDKRVTLTKNFEVK